MDKMETNFKLVIDNDIEITANTISWVSWNGHGLDQAHDGPGAGRSLFLDFKTMPLDMLFRTLNLPIHFVNKLDTNPGNDNRESKIKATDEYEESDK